MNVNGDALEATPEHPIPRLREVATDVGYIVAILGVIGSAIYAVCAAALGVKLWTMNQDWATVVGSLPRGLVVSRGLIGTVVPSLIAGVLAVLAADKLKTARSNRPKWFAAHIDVPPAQPDDSPAPESTDTSSSRSHHRLWLLLAAGVLSAMLFGWLDIASHRYHYVGHRATLVIALVALVFNVVAFWISDVLLKSWASRVLEDDGTNRPNRSQQRWNFIIRAGLMAVAFVPLTTFAFGAVALPTATVCSSDLANGAVDGNFLGSNDDFIYIAHPGHLTAVARDRISSFELGPWKGTNCPPASASGSGLRTQRRDSRAPRPPPSARSGRASGSHFRGCLCPVGVTRSRPDELDVMTALLDKGRPGWR
jgi:hypothetical protein